MDPRGLCVQLGLFLLRPRRCRIGHGLGTGWWAKTPTYLDVTVGWTGRGGELRRLSQFLSTGGLIQHWEHRTGEAESPVSSQSTGLDVSGVPVWHWRPGGLLESCRSSAHIEHLRKLDSDRSSNGRHTHQQEGKPGRFSLVPHYIWAAVRRCQLLYGRVILPPSVLHTAFCAV